MPSLNQLQSSTGSEQLSPPSAPPSNPLPGEVTGIQTQTFSRPTTSLPEVPTSRATNVGGLDWSAIDAKFQELSDFYKKYEGQIGCNPYMYTVRKVKPLYELYQQKDHTFDFGMEKDGKTPTTREQYESRLYAAIMALECSEKYAMHDKEAYQAEQERLKGVLAARTSGQRQVLFN